MCKVQPSDPITVKDVQDIAKSKLSTSVWHYYTTGADEQQTLERNVSIYDRYVCDLYPGIGFRLTPSEL